jgi:hypothetical protein
LTTRHQRRVSPELVNGALRHFGRWSKALQAAGIDPESVSHQRRWTRERVVHRIRELDEQGVRLSYAFVHRVDAGLLHAVRAQFGSWDEALRVAGYDPDAFRLAHPPWTRVTIVDLIRRRYASNLPVARNTIVPCSAGKAALLLFGSWRAALHAAGVPVASTQWPIWSKTSIVQAILRRARIGQPLNTTGMERTARPLYQAARHHFGTWRDALCAAGLDPMSSLNIHPRWTADRLLDEIRGRVDAGINMNSPANCPEPLLRAGRRFFGSWKKTLEAARCD